MTICLGVVVSWWRPLRSVSEALAPVETVPLIAMAPVPIFQASAAAQLGLGAQAAYVMDVPSGSVLYEWNSHELRPSASTTKLMTALVALQLYAPDQVLTVRQEAYTPGTTVGLEWGEQLAFRELLAGLLIHSGNDAAAVLANNHPAGEAGFVAEMNQKAHELHLDHTNFANPSGLDQLNHYTTARDLAILAKEAMTMAEIRDLVSTRITTVTDVTGTHTHELINTNELLKTDSRIIGIKTGTTEEAGQVLVTELVAGDRNLILVVMGSQDRYQDTTQLINWVLAHYEWRAQP